MKERPFGRLRARAFAVGVACAMALLLLSTGMLLALPAARLQAAQRRQTVLADLVAPAGFGLSPQPLGTGQATLLASEPKATGKDKPKPPKDKPVPEPDNPPAEPPLPPVEPPAPPEPPGAVTDVSCVSGDMEDLIVFSAPGLGGPISAYELWSAPASDGPYSLVATAAVDASGFTVAVETTGTPFYRVSAVGPGGQGPASDAVTNGHVSISRCVTPSGATLRASNGEVVLALPAGAYSTDTTVTIEEIEGSPTGGLIWLAGVYQVEPSGPLGAPATLSVAYSLAVTHFQVRATILSQAKIMVYDAASASWVSAANTVESQGMLSGQLSHFCNLCLGAISPHGTSSGAYCADGAICHNLAAYPDSSTRLTGRDSLVCYHCHGGANSAKPDGATGENMETSLSAATSSHPLPTSSPWAVGALYCTICHDPHADPAASPKLLRATTSVGTYVQGGGGSQPGDAYCWACHGSVANRRTAYLVPGYYTNSGGDHKTAYATTAHAAIATGGPTCLSCHDAHGSTQQRLLNARLSASAAETVASDLATGQYALDCLQCHDGSTAGAENIKQYVTAGAADMGSMSFGGHRIKSPSGTLPVNAPLPCIACHGPHGSARGNTTLLSDSLGANLGTGTGTGVRRFCLSCHVTSDLYGWDSNAGAYAAISPAATVYGLARNGGADGTGPYGQGKNWLLLKPANGHAVADSGSCYQCHGNEYGSPDSSNVHDPRSYSASVHLGNPGAESISVRGVNYGSFACVSCHSLDLMQEHGKSSSSSAPFACGGCHPTPRDTFGSWSKGCTQGGCHTTKHGQVDAAHASPAVTCTAAGCHDGTPGLAAIHASASVVVGGQTRTSCAVCHSDGVPTSDCATCHGFTVHPPHNAPGTCTPSGCHGSDPMVTHGVPGGPGCQACHPPATTKTFICRACHPTPAHAVSNPNHSDPTEDCTSCHALSSLTNVHGDRCDWCHDGPVPVYAGGCQQTGCHATRHTNIPGYPNFEHVEAHYNYGSDCWSCHPEAGGNCAGCHYWDRTPPVTTSNARASYTAAAVIYLTPTEATEVSGIRATYYQLDGNPIQTGRIVTVLGPAIGQESHTLEFWSIDRGLNTETHHVVSFTVSAGTDTVAPTGTMSVNSGATYATTLSATANSAVTDAGTGVVRMSIDPGSGVFGDWLEYGTSQPFTLASGDGTKTVRVKYQDALGNELILADTIILDTTPPSGTMSINNGAVMTATAAVTIYSSVTGVVDMRTYDGSFWSVWLPYSATKAVNLPLTDGTRWVTAQYRDVAGNILSISDSIILDYRPPTGTMSVNSNAAYTTTTSVSLNSSMSDPLGGTGISQMRVDTGTKTFGEWTGYLATYAFTLASGDGTKTVRAEYRDAAGNTTLVSDTIVLDTAVPTGTMVVNGDAATTTGCWVSVESAMSDATSGIAQMSVDPGSGVYGSWIPYTPTYVIQLPTGDGTKTVRVQYKDNAGMIATRSDAIELTAASDVQQPVGSVLIDGGASVAKSTSVTLTLSATDEGGSGVTSMRFSNDNASWTSWETYAVTRSWSIASPDGDKLVYVQFRDGAGNVSQVCADAITLDTSLPLGSTSLSIAGGTWVDANDGASGAWGTFSIYVNDVLVGTKAAGASTTWSCPQVETPAGGHIDIVVDCGFSSYAWIFDESRPTTWTVGLPPGAIRLVAATWTGFPTLGVGTDWYDPYEDYYTGVGIGTGTIENIRYAPGTDTTPPTGTISINSGAAYTATTAATLSVTGDDTGGSGVQLMRFSNDNLTWSAWEPFGTSRSWTLMGGTGIKSVYLQIRDLACNISATYSDTIGLDATPPTGSMVINAGASTTTTRTVTLGLSASDVGGSGVSQMRFSNDNATWGAWEPYAATKTWVLPWGDGAKTVYAQYSDGVSNVSSSCSDGITLSTPGGTATLWFRWWGDGEAGLSLLSDTGEVLATTTVVGYQDELSWYVTVPAGQTYHMWCDWYYQYYPESEGGQYGVWTNDPTINPDGILSPGETVIWNY